MRNTQTWPPTAPRAAASAAADGPAIGDGPHSDGPELVGYARVSTRSQNDDSQLAELTTAGCARIFLDHGVSGKLASRPELDKAVAYMRDGDTFLITRLSRAMRSVKHMIALVEELKARGAGLKVLKQDIDTSSATGRLLFHILSAIDEWQRELIVEGTMEGLEAARVKGHKGGRPRALSAEQEDLAMDMITKGTPVATVARSMSASRAAVYRAAIRRGIIEAPDGDGKGGRPALTPETAEEIMRRLRAGENMSAVAGAAGVSHASVLRVWKRSGESGNPPGWKRPRQGGGTGGRPVACTTGQARIARGMLSEGESMASAAQKLGVDRASLYRALDRALDRLEDKG